MIVIPVMVAYVAFFGFVMLAPIEKVPTSVAFLQPGMRMFFGIEPKPWHLVKGCP